MYTKEEVLCSRLNIVKQLYADNKFQETMEELESLLVEIQFDKTIGTEDIVSNIELIILFVFARVDIRPCIDYVKQCFQPFILGQSMVTNRMLHGTSLGMIDMLPNDVVLHIKTMLS